MELDSTIDSCSVIRVAVLAVGEMPAAHLREYVDMVVQHVQVDLSSLSSFYIEHQKSPFTQQPWETGCLRFKFMVGGAIRSPWEVFQVHRKIHGVIGLCHCPLSHDLGATYEQFTAICKAYPSAQVKRCLAFHPSDDQVEQDKNKRQDLVLFPPADRQTLEFHMQTLMQEFAASVLMDFEKRVLLADPVGATMTTPLDSQASLSAEEVSKTKKRRLGRVQKTIGDYCLLAGSPADANAHHLTAVELSRLTGDVFWHAGAAEGSISALVVDRRGRKDQSLEDEVKARYSEVIQLYRRGSGLIFELEACLKLAKYLCRKELVKDVVELLTNAIENGKNLLEANDRLVLFVEVAGIYGALGYERKAALFSRKVVHLYLQQDNQWAALSALQVLNLICKAAYRIQNRVNPSFKPLLNDIKTRTHCTEMACEGQWSTLQIDVLSDILAAAVRGGDALAAWSAAAQLLRGHYPLITPSAQISLATALSSAATRLSAGTRSSDPALPFVRLQSVPSTSLQIEIIKRKPGKKEWWTGSSSSGPFIYTPLAGKRGQSYESEQLQLTWIVGEPAEVLVEVANPCAFEVYVESISLSVEPLEFEAFPFSFCLPPNGSEVVSLSGVPLSAGSLTLRGCFVRYIGVLTEHCFGDIGQLTKGLTLADPFRGSGGLKLRGRPDIMVMPPLPCLVAHVVGGEGAVVLYEGEIRSMTLSLFNIGSVAVAEANISLTGKLRKQVVFIGHDVLQAALPLSPGRTALVPIKLKIGQQEMDTDKRTVGSSSRCFKDGTLMNVVIHYAGPSAPNGKDGHEHAEISPGRRLTIPLQLHVLRGLRLVKARLLSMEIPVQISRTLPVANASNSEVAGSLVNIDPYRGSWSLRLLELELWNGTNVLFEVTVSINGREEVEEGDKIETGPGFASTRIDRDHSARVLIPLEKFKLATLEKASSAKPPVAKQGAKSDGQVSEHKAESELNATIEALCSRICVKWSSGRNSTGELHLNDAIREALKESVFEILFPDPLTFGFRLTKGPHSPGKRGRNEDSCVLAHDLIPMEMLVRNNTMEEISVTLSVACRDVTGASCLGDQQTVLWAGALDGVDVKVPALGETVHTFGLCFLVPGEYTLLGAAVIQSLAEPSQAHESICYCGPPFTVQVAGLT